MKTIRKWIFRLCLAVVLAVVAFVLLLDNIVRALAENRLKAATGLEVKIGKLEIGLLNPTLHLENFVVYNPPEFGGAPLLEMPELHVEYDRPALRRRTLHLTLLRLNLAEINVVKDQQGRSNFEALQDRLRTKTIVRTNKTAGAGFEFAGIDTLNLTLGKYRKTDLRQPDKASEIAFDVRHEIATNVQSLADLTGFFIKIALKRGVNIFSDTPGAARNAAKDKDNKTGDGAKRTFAPVTPPGRK